MTAESSDLRYQELSVLDPEVHAAIGGEIARQRDFLEMIASENFVPRAVLQAQGSVFTNKYAEGSGRRYRLRERRHRRGPGARPGEGSVQRRVRQRPAALRAQANAAVLHALAEAGDKIGISRRSGA